MKTAATIELYKRKHHEHVEVLRRVAASVPSDDVSLLLELAHGVQSASMAGEEARECLYLLLATSPGLRLMMRSMGGAFLALGAEEDN